MLLENAPRTNFLEICVVKAPLGINLVISSVYTNASYSAPAGNTENVMPTLFCYELFSHMKCKSTYSMEVFEF